MNRPDKTITTPRIAVVVPSYRASLHILEVLKGIGPSVGKIYVVDDHSPENTGRLVEQKCGDPRVRVLFIEKNLGVGGAVLAGYKAACTDGADVVVKIDADGQMDPAEVPALVAPILDGEADYAKGNRFFNIEDVKAMPALRLLGNAGLSFLTKLSSGYWNIFDPTNGFTAIHASVAAQLPADKMARRFFFESDMLFRLNMLRAVVAEVPMKAIYGSEKSNLRVGRALFVFAAGHAVNFIKRVAYNYFLRDFNLASIELVIGTAALLFGLAFGTTSWITGARTLTPATAGTVMLSAMPVILGVQLLLGFLSYDISSVPKTPLHRRLTRLGQ